MIMASATSYVKCQWETWDSFNITNGLRQGDILSCLLINIALENAFRKTKIRQGDNSLFRSKIIEFADDISIVGRSRNHIEECYNALESATNRIDLAINPKKNIYGICKKNPPTKILIINTEKNSRQSFVCSEMLHIQDWKTATASSELLM